MKMVKSLFLGIDPGFDGSGRPPLNHPDGGRFDDIDGDTVLGRYIPIIITDSG